MTNDSTKQTRRTGAQVRRKIAAQQERKRIALLEAQRAAQRARTWDIAAPCAPVSISSDVRGKVRAYQSAERAADADRAAHLLAQVSQRAYETEARALDGILEPELLARAARAYGAITPMAFMTAHCRIDSAGQIVCDALRAASAPELTTDAPLTWDTVRAYLRACESWSIDAARIMRVLYADRASDAPVFETLRAVCAYSDVFALEVECARLAQHVASERVSELITRLYDALGAWDTPVRARWHLEPEAHIRLLRTDGETAYTAGHHVTRLRDAERSALDAIAPNVWEYVQAGQRRGPVQSVTRRARLYDGGPSGPERALDTERAADRAADAPLVRAARPRKRKWRA